MSLILTYRITLVNDAQTICVFPVAIKERISRMFSVLFKKPMKFNYYSKNNATILEKNGRVPLKMLKSTVILENGGNFS